jgi:hypothetical protein
MTNVGHARKAPQRARIGTDVLDEEDEVYISRSGPDPVVLQMKFSGRTRGDNVRGT